MSYQFKKAEPLNKGFRRIAVEQLENAIRELNDPHLDRHEAVHQVRKRFKKIRSLARFVRPRLQDHYNEINTWFRNAGQRLARVRDAESVLESIRRLRKRSAVRFAGALCDEIEGMLTARRQRIANEWTGLNEELRRLAGQLEHKRDELQNVTFQEEASGSVMLGPAANYGRGRKAMHKALSETSNERLHEWRKRCKDHWYHMRLLGGLWPPVMQARIAECSRLCDLLGEDHDLAVLTLLLTDPHQELGDAQANLVLKGRIAEERAELQHRAFALGRWIYAETRSALRQRLQAYWDAWKSDEQGWGSP